MSCFQVVQKKRGFATMQTCCAWLNFSHRNEREQFMDVAYRCPFCQHGFSVRVPGVQEAGVVGGWRGLPRRCCPTCGQATAPAAWLDARMAQPDGYWGAFYERWPECRVAPVCAGLDAYRGDCERGRLMPKCLDAIRQETQILLAALPPAISARSVRPRQTARNKPPPESGS